MSSNVYTNDIAPIDFAFTLPPAPFHDSLNVPSADVLALAPHAPARGSENVATLSKSKSEQWDDNTEEGRVLQDMGLEDPEEEDELEAFNSILSAESDGEESDGDRVRFSRAARMDSGYGAMEDYMEQGDSDGESTPGCDEDSSDSSGSESSDSDTEMSVDDHHLEVVDDGVPAHGELLEQCLSSDEEDPAVSDPDEEATWVDQMSDAIPAVGSDLQVAGPSSIPATLRRSTRLASAPKRARDYAEGSEDEAPARPAKRTKTTAASRRRKAKAEPHPTAQTPGADAVAQHAPAAAKKGKQRQVPSKPAPSGSTSKPKGDGKRLQRIPQWFLAKHCIVIESETMRCGFKGCQHDLHLRKAAQTRHHIKDHYTREQLKAAKVKCIWEGCGKTVKSGKNHGELMRHYDEQHLHLRYQCPGKCTDGQGNRRTWVRTDEITRHEFEKACQYLNDHPIPRGQAKDPDAPKNPEKEAKTRSR